MSTVVTEKQVQELPLNGRNFVQLAQLAAGANEGTATAISNGNRPDDRRQTSAVAANGQSDTLNQEFVDGLDNNEATIGTIGVRPSLDAISEFRVITNLYPAEAGKTPGAYINIITKSGTNQIHGSAYEFIRNDAVDARNFFARTGRTPEYRQNQFGGSIGGPIVRDRTFFFGRLRGFAYRSGNDRQQRRSLTVRRAASRKSYGYRWSDHRESQIRLHCSTSLSTRHRMRRATLTLRVRM